MAVQDVQLGRLRSLLAGTGIPFGMYVGKTPDRENEVVGIRMPAGASRADYEARLAQVRKEKSGDLVLHLDGALERDESLSRALVPEVWQVVRREGGGGRHEKERRKFLRFQVLREVALSPRQPIGLEPWGRMRVEYVGLDATLPWIQRHAYALGMPPDDLRDGVASLLDYLRRKRALHDPEFEVFTKFWMEGNQELQQNYLPQLGGPVGTKISRTTNDKPELVTQWLSERGDTTIRQMAKKWGVEADQMPEFLKGLFETLTAAGLLVPVKLKGSKGNPQFLEEGNWDWVQIDASRRLRPGMFVAQVVGKSMEPRIPDGAYCLFAGPVTGTRQGRVVLVELSDAIDPETGRRYTVKRYESEKASSGDGTWRHIRVTLKPDNPSYEPILLTADDEDLVRVVAEVVDVLG